MKARSAAIGVAILGLALGVAGSASAQPRDLETRYRRGVEALQRGDLMVALGTLGAVAAEDASFADVQLLLGQASLAAGLEEAAKDHIERALAQDPRNGFAAFLLGFTLHRAARYHEAVEALDRARELAPENPNPLVYRGLALLELGRSKEAAADLEAALARAPGDATAATGMAELELGRGDFAAAERRLRAVLAQAPAELETRLLLARVLFESQRPAEAVPILEALAAELPFRSDALHLLAQSLLRSGRREEGQRSLARFRELKENEERTKVLEVRLKSTPGDVDGRLELIELYLEGGHPGGALPHLAALERLASGDPRVAAVAARVERAIASNGG